MRFGPSHAALLVGALSVALLTAPLSAQKAQKEPAAGLEFKPPKGWLEVTAGGDRGATVRLYCAPRAAATSNCAGSAATSTPVTLSSAAQASTGREREHAVAMELPGV